MQIFGVIFSRDCPSIGLLSSHLSSLYRAFFFLLCCVCHKLEATQQVWMPCGKFVGTSCKSTGYCTICLKHFCFLSWNVNYTEKSGFLGPAEWRRRDALPFSFLVNFCDFWCLSSWCCFPINWIIILLIFSTPRLSKYLGVIAFKSIFNWISLMSDNTGNANHAMKIGKKLKAKAALRLK